MSKRKGYGGGSSRGGGFPGMGGGGMGNIMSQVQKLQEEMAKTQKRWVRRSLPSAPAAAQ